jgi:hypothetical protein
MTEMKRSSKVFIYDSRQYLYCVYRAPGEWSNPDSISFIGTDGDEVEVVARQVFEKCRLRTEANEWSVVGTVPNPANNETNTIWKLARVTDSLLFLPGAYGGLMCLRPSAIWAFEKMLSPAAASIMRAMPELFVRTVPSEDRKMGGVQTGTALSYQRGQVEEVS